jgi:hypothetical protein
MANYTTPMFCLPFNLTGTGHCRITFAGSSDGGGNVNFDMSTGDLFANRDYTRADNVAADWCTKANAAIATAHPTSPGTFAASEFVSGYMKGMLTLTYTAGHANDNITNIIFLAPTQMSGQDFGFASDTVTPTAAVIGSTHTWESVYVMGRQWIPHRTEAGHVLAWNVEDIDELVVGRESPSADSTGDKYQKRTARQVTIMGVRAASVMPQWAADSDYLTTGQTVSDPNVTFEDFREYWSGTLTTALKTCRYHVDMDAAATYFSVLPLTEWVGNTTNVATISNPAPVLYDFDFAVRVV